MSDLVAGEARMLIAGELVEAKSGKVFENVNPATEETLGDVADGGRADMDRAIGASRAAFDEGRWSHDLNFRKQCLLQLQAAIEKEKELLRAELIAEVGAPLLLTYGPQLDLPLAEAIPWVVEHVDRFDWERELPHSTAFGRKSWRKVLKEPLGVVGAIVPWNYPFEVSIVKVAQSLITGNAVILKPAPDTPWNATRIGRLVAEVTDIPPGIFNVVTSSDHGLGELLVADPRVDCISFTGSTDVGRRIQSLGGPMMKRLFLELGGKSACVVLDDADIEDAVSKAAPSICMHAGQGCAMLSRLLIPRSRYEEAVTIATASMANVPFGDPTSATTLQGPQISAKQRDRVLGYIEKGVEEGARLAFGGGRPAHLPKGFFVEPTLFVDVENSMTIAQEEIFGPVMAMIPYDDDADAVRIANDSAYGLAFGVISTNEERALALAKQVRAGTVSVNGGMWYGADAPFGGYKSSGIGRQNGIEGFAQYTETKSIAGSL
jgi:aldehyde dehydrogenase (NAD+)